MLTMLIPDPKALGKDMYVFLRLLVKELKILWESSICTKYAVTETIFTMRALLLWTINKFPTHSSLLGWSGKSYKACPTCNEYTPSYRVINKFVYIGHRRFLDVNYSLRKRLDFNRLEESRPTLRNFSNDDIQEQLVCLLNCHLVIQPKYGGGQLGWQEFGFNSLK